MTTTTYREPIRSCIACRRRAPVSALIRLAVGRDGGLHVTGVAGRRVVDGRGRYVCPQPRCADIGTRRLLGGRGGPLVAAGLMDQAEAFARRRYERRVAGLRRRRISSDDRESTTLSSAIEQIAAARSRLQVGA